MRYFTEETGVMFVWGMAFGIGMAGAGFALIDWIVR